MQVNKSIFDDKGNKSIFLQLTLIRVSSCTFNRVMTFSTNFSCKPKGQCKTNFIFPFSSPWISFLEIHFPLECCMKHKVLFINILFHLICLIREENALNSLYWKKKIMDRGTSFKISVLLVSLKIRLLCIPRNKLICSDLILILVWGKRNLFHQRLLLF